MYIIPKFIFLLASLPLSAQWVHLESTETANPILSILPPGSGEVRLIAKPLPAKVYKHMTGLGANDAGLWALIVRNTTGRKVTVTLDDWQFVCPGVTFLDSVSAGALLARDTSLSWQSIMYQGLQLAAVGVAVWVDPIAALAVPVIYKAESVTKAAIPNAGSLLAGMKESVTVGPGESGHTMALAGKVKKARSCGGWKE